MSKRNKDICLTCLNRRNTIAMESAAKHGIEIKPAYTPEKFLSAWERGTAYCPYIVEQQVPTMKATPETPPPEECSYILEHCVSQEAKYE